MSDKPTKPRRDLRARLGKTITPKTQGGAPTPPAIGGAAAAEAAPTPKAKAPGLKPPVGLATPPPAIAAPPFAATSDVAPPPFAQAAAPEPEGPVDPFGAASAPSEPQQVVRLEFDDKLVTDQEVGKTAKTRVLIVALVTLVVGCGIGWGVGQLLARRDLFARTVADAEFVYGKVNTASERMLEVQRHVNTLANAATGNPAMGEDPRVDYDTITALRAIEKPFDATAFTNKNYNALGGDVVNNLFSYVMNIERTFQEIQRLANETLPQNRREALDSSAADSSSGVARFGAVLIRNEDDGSIQANLGFADAVRANAEGQPRIPVRSHRGGQAFELTPFTGAAGQEIGTDPTFVVMVNNERSGGVLREQSSAFIRYRQHLNELKALVDQTVQTQGALLTSIGTAITQAGGDLNRAAAGGGGGGGE